MTDKKDVPKTEFKDEIWVNDFTEKSATKFREQLFKQAEEEPGKPIIVYIDSYGGYVDSLAKMIETMNEVRATSKIITVASGKAMSCGAVLLSHGDVRFCGEMSRTMIHNISNVSWGDAYDQKENSDEIMRLNKKFMGLLAANCKISYSELQKRIKDTTSSKEIWMDPEASKKFGLVDEIGTPVLKSTMIYECLTLRTDEAEEPKKPKKTAKKKKTASKKRS